MRDLGSDVPQCASPFFVYSPARKQAPQHFAVTARSAAPSPFSPAPPEVADRLIQRKDDTEEAVRTRLAKYHSETAPIIPFYQDKSILKRVDGVGAPADVAARIAAALSM